MKNFFKLTGNLTQACRRQAKVPLVLIAIVAFMLVSGGGRAFAIDNAKMPARPQKWVLLVEAGEMHPRHLEDNIMLVKNVGAWSASVEMKDGSMYAVGSNIMSSNMVRIKTVNGQYIEFVTWNGTAQWDTIKAKKGSYWRLEPNSELVFESPNGKITGFWLRYGKASIDANYITVGEAVEFTEAIAKTVNYSKVKSQVADWKKLLDSDPKPYGCIASGPGRCGCKGDLAQHTINQYYDDAGRLGVVLGALPAALALPGAYMEVMKKYRMNAALAYAVACAYGKFPTQREFELDLLELLSGGTRSQARSEQIKGMAGMVRDEFIEKASIQIAKKIAPNLISIIPGAGTAIGAVVGAVTGGSEANTFGNKARDYYKP